MNEETASSAGRRILIVEDEMVVAMLLEDMLEELDYEAVATVARENDALAAISGNIIDAVILDVNLNGERSYAIADALIEKGIPLIFATGYGAGSLEPQYRNHTVLPKPFRIGELAEALRKLLSPDG